MKTEEEYIRPTKDNPVFVASCDYFGYIEESTWKDYLVETSRGDSVGRTFALHYKQAVNRLHEWIQENPEVLASYPKCKFDILLVDGTYDKFDSAIQKKVYTISATKAKQLLF
jgi:hypothetical protein